MRILAVFIVTIGLLMTGAYALRSSVTPFGLMAANASDAGGAYSCRLNTGRALYSGDNRTVAISRCVSYALWGESFFTDDEPVSVATYFEDNSAGGLGIKSVVMNGICDKPEESSSVEWEGVIATVPADANNIQIPIQYVQPGKCLAVTAFDTSGNESEKSPAICFTIAE